MKPKRVYILRYSNNETRIRRTSASYSVFSFSLPFLHHSFKTDFVVDYKILYEMKNEMMSFSKGEWEKEREQTFDVQCSTDSFLYLTFFL